MKNNDLHDWIFHYNIYAEKWEAAKREHYVYLFSDRKPEYVISAKRIDVLIELINKTKGNINKINKLDLS